jgi:hypothetical protein
MDPESVAVTAGLGGFVSFFLLAVALYFLMRNMNARMRRMAYREEQETRAAQAGPGRLPSDPARPDRGPDQGPDVG